MVNADTTTPEQLSFDIPPELVDLVTDWHFWWRVRRPLMKGLALLLDLFTGGDRLFLLIDVTPGPDAWKTRRMVICRAKKGTTLWELVKKKSVPVLFLRSYAPTVKVG